jgi:hypothetical protein
MRLVATDIRSIRILGLGLVSELDGRKLPLNIFCLHLHHLLGALVSEDNDNHQFLGHNRLGDTSLLDNKIVLRFLLAPLLVSTALPIQLYQHPNIQNSRKDKNCLCVPIRHQYTRSCNHNLLDQDHMEPLCLQTSNYNNVRILARSLISIAA